MKRGTSRSFRSFGQPFGQFVVPFSVLRGPAGGALRASCGPGRSPCRSP